MIIYLKLYLVFFQIGLLAFGGGYAALPLIQEYIVNRNAWITNDVMLDIVSISQMTPGPIAINSATFVGLNIGGILGAIVATIGVVTPQIIIITIFLKLIGINNRYISYMLNGIGATIVALIATSCISLINSSIIQNFNYFTLLIFLIGVVMYYKKASLIKLIIFAGICGFLKVLIGII